MGVGRRVFAGATVLALAMTASPALAQDEERGIDPNQGETLVEVNLANKAAAIRLQLEAETYGVEFNDHYLRKNRDGSGHRDRLRDQGRARRPRAGRLRRRRGHRGPGQVGEPDRGARSGVVAKEERAEDAARRQEAHAAAVDPTPRSSILRADYFENYAGRFLSVEAKTREASVDARRATTRARS